MKDENGTTLAATMCTERGTKEKNMEMKFEIPHIRIFEFHNLLTFILQFCYGSFFSIIDTT